MNSTSTDWTNHKLKSSFFFKFQKVPESKTQICHALASIHIAFTLYFQVFDNIDIVLGIISNIEIILSIKENVHRLYANTMPFYISDLNIQGFLYPIPHRWQGGDCSYKPDPFIEGPTFIISCKTGSKEVQIWYTIFHLLFFFFSWGIEVIQNCISLRITCSGNDLHITLNSSHG